MKDEKNEEVTVEIPAIEIKTFQLKLVGDTPFISHAWSEKAKREMLEKQMKKLRRVKKRKTRSWISATAYIGFPKSPRIRQWRMF